MMKSPKKKIFHVVYACLESFWATKENITHSPRNPRRLKNAEREYDLSSSSVRNEAKIRRILAMIIGGEEPVSGRVDRSHQQAVLHIRLQNPRKGEKYRWIR